MKTMSTRIMCDQENGVAALYNSVTETAFGPLFHDYNDDEVDITAEDVAGMFLKWFAKNYETDPRVSVNLGDLLATFVADVLPDVDCDNAEDYEP
jgi:hypothetical protein